MIISFARTTPALLAGAKTVTRRDWKASHAAHFKAGTFVDAWDRSPRNGGKKVADIYITVNPYQELTSEAPEEDWHAEGFGWMTKNGLELHHKGVAPWMLWESWKKAPVLLWVVRFRLVGVENVS